MTCALIVDFTTTELILIIIISAFSHVESGVCVCVCFLPIHSGHQVRWTYQPGSHRIFHPPSFCGCCCCFFFTLTDRASTIPSNTRGCQSGTWSAGQKKIRGVQLTSSRVRLGQSFKTVGCGCTSCWGDVGAGSVEADVFYIPFIVSVQYIGY